MSQRQKGGLQKSAGQPRMEMGADGTDGNGGPLSDPAQKQGGRKSAEQGKRVDVGGRSRSKECAQCDTDCASAAVASAVGDYFRGTPLQLNLVKSAGRSAAGADTYRDCRDTWA